MNKEDFEKLKSPEVLRLIKEFSEFDPEKFILKFAGTSSMPVSAMAEQIKSRKKARTKLFDLPVDDMLFMPVPLEQASGTLTASFKAGLISGDRIIDLTGGLGIDSFFFAHRFKDVFHCEQNEVLSSIADYNAGVAGIRNINFTCCNSIEFLKSFPDKHFDWIYVDPARRDETSRSVDIHYLQPDVANLDALLLAKSKNVMIKLSPAFDINEAIKTFPALTRFVVVSVNNECKEALLILSDETKELRIAGVELSRSYPPIIIETPFAKSRPTIRESDSPGNFLYETFCGISKAGLNNFVAQEFNLTAYLKSEYYFFSSTRQENFPGKIFEIIEKIPYNIKTLKKMLRRLKIDKLNIKAKGIAVKPEDVTKKLKLKNGGDYFLFILADNELTEMFLTKIEKIHSMDL